MANLGFRFDATQVAPATGQSSQLPVSDANGWPVVITADEMKPVKDKPGAYMLVLTLRIFEGPNAGATGPYRLNIAHPSEDTVRIAYQQLSAIAYVTGVMQFDDAAALHNRPFRVVVGQQADSRYTEVKGVLDINGNPPGQQGAAPQAAPVASGFAQQPAQAGGFATQAQPCQPPAFGQQPAAQPAFSPAASTPPWAQQR